RGIRLGGRGDGRLVENDALAADVDERVGRPEVDGKIIREHPGQQVVEHHRSIVCRLNPRRGFNSSTVRATQKRKLYFYKALGNGPAGRQSPVRGPGPGSKYFQDLPGAE